MHRVHCEEGEQRRILHRVHCEECGQRRILHRVHGEEGTQWWHAGGGSEHLRTPTLTYSRTAYERQMYLLKVHTVYHNKQLNIKYHFEI